MRQLVLDIRPDAPPSFDNFVAGDNLALLAALAQTVIGAGHLYLWGPPSSGRSHLLRAAVSSAEAAGRPAFHVEAEGLAGPLPDEDGALIAVDDVERLSPDAQIALFNTFNRAPMLRQTLVLGGPAPPRLLDRREDLRTRIGQCLVFELKPLDDDTRRAILATLAERRGLALGDDVVDFLLRHGRRDITSLARIVDALDHASLEQKRPVTLPLLRKLMQAGLDI